YTCLSTYLSLLLFLIFYCYPHRLDLHSFPTRRSSDLVLSISSCTVTGSGAFSAFEQPASASTASGSAYFMAGPLPIRPPRPIHPDRKNTRLNSSHVKISYAVFCLKKNTSLSGC